MALAYTLLVDKNNPSKIILPPRELFKNKQSRLSEKVGNSDYHYDLERAEIVTDHGSRLFFKGMKFPIKGWPYMEAIFVCNIVKRQTMMIAFSLARKEFLLPALAFIFTPFKFKIKILENFLKHYNRNADYLLNDIFLEEKYMIECSREIRKFIRNFLNEIGISKEASEKTAEIFSHLIEYDDSYRYRFEDLMSETSQYLMMKSPTKEIQKIIAFHAEREVGSGHIISPKFKSFASIMSFILFIPKIRRAFKHAVLKSDFKNFQLDEADIYHTLLRTDYNVRGKPVEERKKIYDEYHKDGYPPLIPTAIPK